MLYSTYVGGSGSDGLHGIALDATGTIYAGFSTYSANFPVTAGAFQTVFGGTNDAGVLKLNPTGTGLVYSTYLGGPGGEDPARIAIDGSGNAYLLGRVYSGGFPTTPNALQPTYPGGNAVFLAKLNASGSTLLYSSYVGGSGDSRPTGIAVDSQSNVYVAMGTDATNAPTVNALQPTNAGAHDLYLAKIQLVSYAASVQQPINADSSSVFNASRGVIPVKFTLTLGGSPTCDLPPATIALTRTAGAAPGPIDESIYMQSADTGSNFRISGCQYIYNLASKSLGVGTYRVDILINLVIVGSAVFGLK